MNRVIRLGPLHSGRNFPRFVRPRPPIAGNADLHPVINLINPSAFSRRCVISKRVLLMKPILRHLRTPFEQPPRQKRPNRIVSRSRISRPPSMKMRRRQRMRIPRIIPEIFAAPRRSRAAGRSISILLRFRTHLLGPQRRQPRSHKLPSIHAKALRTPPLINPSNTSADHRELFAGTHSIEASAFPELSKGILPAFSCPTSTR
jgi:hypothetical protein